MVSRRNIGLDLVAFMRLREVRMTMVYSAYDEHLSKLVRNPSVVYAL